MHAWVCEWIHCTLWRRRAQEKSACGNLGGRERSRGFPASNVWAAEGSLRGHHNQHPPPVEPHLHHARARERDPLRCLGSLPGHLQITRRGFQCSHSHNYNHLLFCVIISDSKLWHILHKTGRWLLGLTNREWFLDWARWATSEVFSHWRVTGQKTWGSSLIKSTIIW